MMANVEGKETEITQITSWKMEDGYQDGRVSALDVFLVHLK